MSGITILQDRRKSEGIEKHGAVSWTEANSNDFELIKRANTVNILDIFTYYKLGFSIHER